MMDYSTLKLKPLSQEAMQQMQHRLDNLAKPVHSMGRLEELADHLAGIYHTTNFAVQPRKCLVFAADNGVVHEGVSASPEKITAIQAVNMMNGHTTVAALARAYRCAVQVYDVGIKTDLNSTKVKDLKIRRESGDMLKEPAMTLEQAQRALDIGFQEAKYAIQEGNQMICVGELGMANTTAASAIIAALLNRPAKDVVGRGSNISDQRLQHKVEVVDASLARAGFTNGCTDPLRVLSEVGALELGAMTGAILGAGMMQKPVLLDGFLSYSAALLAKTFVPAITDYMIPSHKSKEPGSAVVLDALGLDPYIDINMCVGEGSGAMMLLPWIDGIKATLGHMNTLQEMNFNFIP